MPVRSADPPFLRISPAASPVFAVLALLVAATSNPGLAATNAPVFLRRHCAECHSGDTSEGALRIDDVPLDLAVAGAADHWERIITRVATMPDKQPVRLSLLYDMVHLALMNDSTRAFTINTFGEHHDLSHHGP
jgi:mono/diheme cytochrome c family protein